MLIIIKDCLGEQTIEKFKGTILQYLKEVVGKEKLHYYLNWMNDEEGVTLELDEREMENEHSRVVALVLEGEEENVFIMEEKRSCQSLLYRFITRDVTVDEELSITKYTRKA